MTASARGMINSLEEEVVNPGLHVGCGNGVVVVVVVEDVRFGTTFMGLNTEKRNSVQKYVKL